MKPNNPTPQSRCEATRSIAPNPQPNPAPAWTPGPWIASPEDRESIIATNGPALSRTQRIYEVARVSDCGLRTAANRDLIATAPEMAEALRRANIGLGYIYAHFRGQASRGLAEQFAGESMDEIRAILARLHGEGGGV